MRSGLIRSLVLVAALGMMGACSDDEKSSDTTAAATVTFPTGVFVPVGATSASDRGSMEYKADGTWVATTAGGNPLSEGTYTVAGDQLTFVTDSYCEVNTPGSNPVTYTFTWDGTTFHFEPNAADTCADRASTLAIDSKLLETTS